MSVGRCQSVGSVGMDLKVSIRARIKAGGTYSIAVFRLLIGGARRGGEEGRRQQR